MKLDEDFSSDEDRLNTGSHFVCCLGCVRMTAYGKAMTL